MIAITYDEHLENFCLLNRFNMAAVGLDFYAGTTGQCPAASTPSARADAASSHCTSDDVALRNKEQLGAINLINHLLTTSGAAVLESTWQIAPEQHMRPSWRSA